MRSRSLIPLLSLLAFTTAGSMFFACRTVEPAPFLPSGETREELPAATSLEIQYIANEGVLISTRDKRVLIDGLHRKYKDAYAYLPDAERTKIEGARPPFDKIDLILVSHMHGDHFHPESVGSYLRNSPATLFVSSQQVVDETAAKFAGYAEVKARVTSVAYELKSRQPKKLAGVDIEFLGVGHGERHAEIQNLGHVISIGGKTVLHIVDAEFTPEIFDALDLDTRGIDIAVLPFWFLTAEAGRKIVEQHIKPKHVIATHIGPSEAKQTTNDVKRHFPKADVFTTLLEKRTF